MNEQWHELKAMVRSESTALDAFITDTLNAYTAAGKKIFCASGCSNCCSLFVQATLAEALIVAEGLDAAQLCHLEAYLCRQREALAGKSDFLDSSASSAR